MMMTYMMLKVYKQTRKSVYCCLYVKYGYFLTPKFSFCFRSDHVCFNRKRTHYHLVPN